MTMPHAIIVDLDGTLCLIGDRSPYDAANCHLDTRNEQVYDYMVKWSDLNESPIILMSGRQEKDRQVTADWLAEHWIPYDELHMRSTGDNRNDAVIKRELYERHVKDRYEIFLVLDDRQRVVDMWREIGLVCWQVNPSAD